MAGLGKLVGGAQDPYGPPSRIERQTSVAAATSRSAAGRSLSGSTNHDAALASAVLLWSETSGSYDRRSAAIHATEHSAPLDIRDALSDEAYTAEPSSVR